MTEFDPSKINLTEIMIKNSKFKEFLRGTIVDSEKFRQELFEQVKLIKGNIEELKLNRAGNEVKIRELEKLLDSAKEIEAEYEKKLEENRQKMKMKEAEIEIKKKEENDLKLKKITIEKEFMQLEDKKNHLSIEQHQWEMKEKVAQKKQKDLEAKLNETKRTQNEIEKELQTIELALQNHTKKYNDCQKKLSTSKGEKGVLELKIDQLKKNELELEKKILTLKMQNDFLYQEVSRLENEMKQHQQRIDMIQQQIDALQTQIDQLYIQKSQIQDSYHTSKSGWGPWRKTHHHHVSRQGERDAVQSHINNIVNHQNALRQEKSQYQSYVRDCMTRITTHKFEINAKAIEIETTKLELNFNTERKLEAIAGRSLKIKEIQKLEVENMETQSEIDILNNRKIITVSSKTQNEQNLQETKDYLANNGQERQTIQTNLENTIVEKDQLTNKMTAVEKDLNEKEKHLGQLKNEKDKLFSQKLKIETKLKRASVNKFINGSKIQSFKSKDEMEHQLIKGQLNAKSEIAKAIKKTSEYQKNVKSMIKKNNIKVTLKEGEEIDFDVVQDLEEEINLH